VRLFRRGVLVQFTDIQGDGKRDKVVVQCRNLQPRMSAMKKSKLQLWCKKHEAALVYSGAVIVFFTFVVREGLGERWQRNAELVAAAQNMHSIRGDIKDLSSSIEWVRKDIHGVREAMAEMNQKIKPGFDTDNFSLAEWVYGEAMDDLSKTEDTLTYAKILTEPLPKDDPYRACAESMTIKIADLRTKLRNANVSYGMPEDTEDPKKWRSQVGPRYLDTVHPIRDSVVKLRGSIDDLAWNIAQDAERIRKRNETYSVWAKWISAVLFILGWGLGLLGKLHGVPEAAGE
jgi:hypothetical protein